GARRQGSAHGAAPLEGETVPAPHPLNADPVQLGVPGRTGPAARDQIDLVSPPRQPAEERVQVNLRPSGMRVLAIVPVDDEDLHNAPDSRATASRTPLM